MVDAVNGFLRKVPTWVIYVLCALPAPVLFWMGLTGRLGVEPIERLEHEYGEIALQLLIIGLCITPLRRFFGLNLLKFRRAFGLLAFFYVVLHVMVWLFLDVQILAQIWADILKRPYVTIGMAAFLLMLPLALTSNNRSLRRLGSKWHSLHRLTYGVVLLAGIHFLWVRKGFQFEPIIYLVAISALLSLRIAPFKRARVASVVRGTE